jgi:hypothetical protein
MPFADSRPGDGPPDTSAAHSSRICNELVFCFERRSSRRAPRWRGSLENSLKPRSVRERHDPGSVFLPDGHDFPLARRRGKDARRSQTRLAQAIPAVGTYPEPSSVRARSTTRTASDGRASLAELARTAALSGFPAGSIAEASRCEVAMRSSGSMPLSRLKALSGIRGKARPQAQSRWAVPPCTRRSQPSPPTRLAWQPRPAVRFHLQVCTSNVS